MTIYAAADNQWLPCRDACVVLHRLGTVDVRAFYVARLPVTEMDFEEFLSADGGFFSTKWWNNIQDGRAVPPPSSLARPTHPRIHVSWFDAVAYARWKTEQLGTAVRLPTEWEWVAAATANDQRRFPWGDGFRSSCCNSRQLGVGHVIASETFVSGAAPTGAIDMVGNAWERCLGLYSDPANVAVSAAGERTIRGGSWASDPIRCDTRSRQVCVTSRRFNDGGFRLVRTTETEPPSYLTVRARS